MRSQQLLQRCRAVLFDGSVYRIWGLVSLRQRAGWTNGQSQKLGVQSHGYRRPNKCIVRAGQSLIVINMQTVRFRFGSRVLRLSEILK